MSIGQFNVNTKLYVMHESQIMGYQHKNYKIAANTQIVTF
jgi:hypothetical protein